jgi:lysyl-tRNA synthetase class 2
MEFLVVATIEAMRERDIKEVSLNFATFSKYMHEPHGLFERLVAIVAHRLDGYMQIESLYRFNVKFLPRWNPRYLIYEGHVGLLRAGLASLWAEGQIPKPRLPGKAHHGQQTLKPANR